MRPYFIVNPVAGGKKAVEAFEAIADYLRSRSIDFGYVFTSHAGQAGELAEAAYLSGERFIVAVGGDGTISETASCLYTKSDVIMGICPFGTGNDFARVLKLPTEPEAVAEMLLGGVPSPVDIGMANDKPFTNVGGIGFDVDVVINTERYKARFHGMLPYLMGIIRSLVHLRHVSVTITADGESFSDDITICAVGNGSHFGGGMAALPEAKADDGLFDVCVVKRVGVFKLLRLLPSFIKGRHINKSCVRYFRAAEVTVDCERTPMQLDGELGQYTPVKFRVLPGALTLMLPKARRQ